MEFIRTLTLIEIAFYLGMDRKTACVFFVIAGMHYVSERLMNKR